MHLLSDLFGLVKYNFWSGDKCQRHVCVCRRLCVRVCVSDKLIRLQGETKPKEQTGGNFSNSNGDSNEPIPSPCHFCLGCLAQLMGATRIWETRGDGIRTWMERRNRWTTTSRPAAVILMTWQFPKGSHVWNPTSLHICIRKGRNFCADVENCLNPKWKYFIKIHSNPQRTHSRQEPWQKCSREAEFPTVFPGVLVLEKCEICQPARRTSKHVCRGVNNTLVLKFVDNICCFISSAPMKNPAQKEDELNLMSTKNNFDTVLPKELLSFLSLIFIYMWCAVLWKVEPCKLFFLLSVIFGKLFGLLSLKAVVTTFYFLLPEVQASLIRGRLIGSHGRSLTFPCAAPFW